jgi:hypothetical protein
MATNPVVHRVITAHACKVESGYRGHLEVVTIRANDEEFQDNLPCPEIRATEDEAYSDAKHLQYRLDIPEVIQGA